MPSAPTRFTPLRTRRLLRARGAVRRLLALGADPGDIPSQNTLEVMPLHSALAGRHWTRPRPHRGRCAPEHRRRRLDPLHYAAHNGDVGDHPPPAPAGRSRTPSAATARPPPTWPANGRTERSFRFSKAPRKPRLAHGHPQRCARSAAAAARRVPPRLGFSPGKPETTEHPSACTARQVVPQVVPGVAQGDDYTRFARTLGRGVRTEPASHGSRRVVKPSPRTAGGGAHSGADDDAPIRVEPSSHAR